MSTLILGDFIGKLELPLPESIVNDLEKFSKAFAPMPHSTVMDVFIKKLLTSSDLSPTLGEDQKFNCSQEIFHTSFEFLDKALVFLEDKDNFIFKVLRDDVSPYNYEVIDCILKRLDDKDLKSEQILEFISSYSRTCPPNEEEIDRWLNSKSLPFPHILAKHRLPFHTLMDAKSNPKLMFKVKCVKKLEITDPYN